MQMQGVSEEMYYEYTKSKKEDITKLFDLIDGNGLVDIIFEAIPEYELNTLEDGVNETTKAYYKYKNSIIGIVDAIVNDYDSLNLNATEIQAKLADPDNLELLKTILTKLG